MKSQEFVQFEISKYGKKILDELATYVVRERGEDERSTRGADPTIRGGCDYRILLLSKARAAPANYAYYFGLQIYVTRILAYFKLYIVLSSTY